MRVGVVAFTLIALFLVGDVAFAQERGRIGVSTGYPAKIGVLWHVTERIALRPAASVRQSSSDPRTVISLGGLGGSATTVSSSGTTAVGFRVDTLFSIGVWDNVHAYVAPGYEYRWSRSSSVVSTVNTGPFAPPNRTETLKTNGHDHEVGGTFGARYVPHRRFGVFGEGGVSYSASRTTLFDTLSRGHAWGTISSVGVIFYF